MDEGGCGGRARGSAMRVTAWQRAQRMDPAPGGTCRGVRQLEQFTSRLLYMAAVGNLGKMVGAELGFREALSFFSFFFFRVEEEKEESGGCEKKRSSERVW